MIIGIYKQSFFGGGYYYKISKKENEAKYKFEMCHSVIPNDVPGGAEYIREYNTIEFSKCSAYEKDIMNSKLNIRYLDKNILIDLLISNINSMDLEKIFSKEYYNSDTIDGENWCFFIEYKGNKHYIKGYGNKPEEIENVVYMLYKIGEKYIKNSFNGILGLAIGDAMGVPVEFVSRDDLYENPITEMIGFGSHKVPKGTWSDDTSMTLATVDSIKNTGKIDYLDIANNFLKWFKDAEYTANGEVFDIGRTTLRALAKFEESNNPYECGESNELNNGNGSLMRILPIAYYCYYKGGVLSSMPENEVLEIVKKVSSITHGHEISILGCYIYTIYAIRLLCGDGKYDAYEYIRKLDYSMFKEENLGKYDRLLGDISKLKINEIRSSGYIVDTLEATIWVLLNTNNFNQAIIGAINLGDDTDTVGACTGGLAGIIYGTEQMNEEWKKSLLKYDYIEKLCKEFDQKLGL